MATLIEIIQRIRKIHFLIQIPTVLALTLFFQSLSRGRDFPAAFLLNFLCCTAATFAIQTAVALVSILGRTELLYDLSGAGGFMFVVGLSLNLGRGGGGVNGGEYGGLEEYV
ncbi:hypothetical protein C8A01DRAFT_41659, partial [Parachaetomium inaequale]